MVDTGFPAEDLETQRSDPQDHGRGRAWSGLLCETGSAMLDPQLPDLQKLRDTIRNEINAWLSVTTKRPPLFRTRYQKGLLWLAHKLPLLKKSWLGLATNPRPLKKYVSLTASIHGP
jgi:hypothetical protein